MFKNVILSVFLCLIISSVSASPTKTQKITCKATWDNILKKQKLAPLYSSLKGLCGKKFREGLWKKIATNKDLGYRPARQVMFSILDNDGGEVCGVYSTECIATTSIPDAKYFNTEHSWCQSWGATGKAKSDLHHLYPVKSRLNSKRNNYPFCEVEDATWGQDGSYFGKSFSGTTCFEPPRLHKGELARAMLYFSVRYTRPIDSEQEEFFRQWSKDQRVTSKEYYRNEGIYKHQGNRNPFVNYPGFADLILDF